MSTVTYTQAMGIKASNLVSYMVSNSIGEERELNGKTIFSYEGVDLVVLGKEARFCHLVDIAQEITPFTQKRARVLATLCKSANKWTTEIKARKADSKTSVEDLLSILKTGL